MEISNMQGLIWPCACLTRARLWVQFLIITDVIICIYMYYNTNFKRPWYLKKHTGTIPLKLAPLCFKCMCALALAACYWCSGSPLPRMPVRCQQSLSECCCHQAPSGGKAGSWALDVVSSFTSLIHKIWHYVASGLFLKVKVVTKGKCLELAKDIQAAGTATDSTAGGTDHSVAFVQLPLKIASFKSTVSKSWKNYQIFYSTTN